MKRRWPYLLSGAVGVLSFAVAWSLPTQDVIKTMLTVPGVAGLVGVVFLIVHEQMKHGRALELQALAHGNELAVASHMAARAFDKHAEFVDEYFLKFDQAVRFTIANGPHVDAVRFASDLLDIRRRFTPWLTQEIDEGLLAFEHHSLRMMGAKTAMLGSINEIGPRRTAFVEQTHELFSVIVGMGRREHLENEELKKAIAAQEVTQRLRDFLGIGKLTDLRKRAIAQALRSTPESITPPAGGRSS